MAFDINGTKFLLHARRNGVSFAQTAMIGRQEMHITEADLRANSKMFGVDMPEETGTLTAGYAEPFLELLGADEVVSFDASTYENASVVHDFNLPIPDEYKGRFSTVIDGGTLEHIFNFPTAIKNCMEMVADGGHYLAITPGNNQLGHGFYQFSPELYFRIFSAQNGFELEQMMLFEESPGSPWFEVTDPDLVKERVILINGLSTMLLIIAKKTETVDIFRSAPQQSDYMAAWKDGPVEGQTVAASNASNLSPMAALRQLRVKFDRYRGMLNRRPTHFKKVDLP
jgi:hypothetical protein